jgi:hypothetical protein
VGQRVAAADDAGSGQVVARPLDRIQVHGIIFFLIVAITVKQTIFSPIDKLVRKKPRLVGVDYALLL